MVEENYFVRCRELFLILLTAFAFDNRVLEFAASSQRKGDTETTQGRYTVAALRR